MEYSGIKKAMILCAGEGTRLLPITKAIPKSLVPVLNIPSFFYPLFLLKKAGIEEVIINLNHLAPVIEAFIAQTNTLGIKISFSKEHFLLGTGGGVKKAQVFFEGKPFVLCNCDFITNIDLLPLIQTHLSKKATATMVLYDNKGMKSRYGGVGTDEKENLCVLPKFQTKSSKRTGAFTGIHLLTGKIFSYLEETPCSINEVLYPQLMKTHPSAVHGSFLQGNDYWLGTGELNTLWEATMVQLGKLQTEDPFQCEMLRQFGYEPRQPQVWAPKGAVLPNGAEISPPVIIGKNCQWKSHTRIGPFAVIGDNSELDKGVSIERSVLLPESQLSREQQISHGLVFGQDRILHGQKLQHPILS